MPNETPKHQFLMFQPGEKKVFRDRTDAAHRLVAKLLAYQTKKPLVLAIPRGAVSMAKIIANQLKGDLDVVLVRKLRAPQQPELAIGAINESGWTFLTDFAERCKADADYIESEKRTQLQTIRQRRAQYTPIRPRIDPSGRTVIVVDDGLATGATMMAALHGLRAAKPARLVCAVPVSPPDTLVKVANLADEVVCLACPANFRAVSEFYQYFPQVSDEEVAQVLSSARAPLAAAGQFRA